ncbi:MAG: hypothetical protein JOY54_21125 [Acidobacteriaceae bacterium]|nr:hypothetical protein [Acidobacteriaceae bacterium]
MSAGAASSAAVRASSREATQPAVKAAGVPWYIWCAVLAVTSATIGAHWDISWHKSIGRDTFWTPAHMAIYLCGVLAGIAFGYLILFTTFSKSAPLAPASVRIWGFRAPLGAFIASWGGIAMLTSAPFDNWWHDAYGLDVKIVSPPHILLFAGTYAVILGTLVLIAGYINRASGGTKETARRLFIYGTGIVLVMIMVLLMEYNERSDLHQSTPYIAMALLATIPLAVAPRVTGFKYAATAVAAFYMLFNIGLILVLPLFPAQPKLGPVYQHVTQFIPPEFPILLIVPAFALDLFWRRSKNWNAWLTAAVSGLLFVGLLLAAEWPFADFLMSPASRNRFFGTMYFWYGLPPATDYARYVFHRFETPAEFWRGIVIAAGLATITLRWGLSRGEWLGKIKR